VQSSRIVRCLAFFFFFSSSRQVRQAAGLVDWTTSVFFFLGCSASWEHIGTGPCLVRDIWISIIEAQIVVLVLDRNSIKRPRSTLRSRR
jgi:hypothetical protein